MRAMRLTLLPWRTLTLRLLGPRAAAAAVAAEATPVTLTLSGRLRQLAFRTARASCTASGAVGLTVFGLVVCPYVWRRAPLSDAESEALDEDLMQITALDRGDKLSAAEIWAAVAELRVPPFSFHDLQRPLCFGLFQLVGRFTFACYSDASGVMTLQEFHCAVHKMVDLALEIHSHVVVAIGAGHARSSPVARAKAVRELSSLMVPGLFRVLDFDASGDIGTHEFLRGALLLLATVQGAPLDTPQLAELAFRLADSDGDGYVTALELGRWVARAVEHGVLEPELQMEPRGPFGLFGERRLEPAQLAAKWLREADLDRDGKLLPDEFRVLAPRLRLHRVISSMAQCFAAQMPSE
ncbi:Calcineurin subunit B (Calcineurin regulatory subunit) (Protein phosphatase 2B regulatory subunit) [Durusdinium trenchii]|uniref:Calcineurin subunit B (Calcineurin regulatory subunit) (Protein phosphatase 2B regulatory subunit) n=1 Tax=Durusdinium trenchii TaxID=1381693 RepID=A0ABP0RGL2_9DINO